MAKKTATKKEKKMKQKAKKTATKKVKNNSKNKRRAEKMIKRIRLWKIKIKRKAKKVWAYAKPRIFNMKAEEAGYDNNGNLFIKRGNKIAWWATIERMMRDPIHFWFNVISLGALNHNPAVEHLTRGAVRIGVLSAGLILEGWVLPAAVGYCVLPDTYGWVKGKIKMLVAWWRARKAEKNEEKSEKKGFFKRAWNFVKDGVKKWWDNLGQITNDPFSAEIPSVHLPVI